MKLFTLFSSTALLLFSLQASAIQVGNYVGTDESNQECHLDISQVDPDGDRLDYHHDLAFATVSYSETEFQLRYPLEMDFDARKMVTNKSKMVASWGDENQAEIISLQLDEAGDPISYSYFDNTGATGYFKPTKKLCQF